MKAHDKDNLLLKFFVEEEVTKAEYTNNQEPVWRDSCVEVFILDPIEEKNYFNFEFNAIGTCLAFQGPTRENRTPLSISLLGLISTHSSLSNSPFKEKHVGRWQLTIILPKICFGLSKHHSLSNIRLKANSYKCGDSLSKPHWISLFPIVTDQPNFHKPEYFGIFQL